MRSLGPGNCVRYIRYLVISGSAVNKQYTNQRKLFNWAKIVYYIRYFVIADLFIMSFHCTPNLGYWLPLVITKKHPLSLRKWEDACGPLMHSSGGRGGGVKISILSLQAVIGPQLVCMMNHIYFAPILVQELNLAHAFDLTYIICEFQP